MVTSLPYSWDMDIRITPSSAIPVAAILAPKPDAHNVGTAFDAMMLGLDTAASPAVVAGDADTAPLDSEKPDERAGAPNGDDDASVIDSDLDEIADRLPGKIDSAGEVTVSGAERTPETAGPPFPPATGQLVATSEPTNLASNRPEPVAVRPEAIDMRHSGYDPSYWKSGDSGPKAPSSDTDMAAELPTGIATGFIVDDQADAVPPYSPAAHPTSSGLARTVPNAVTAADKFAAAPEISHPNGLLASSAANDTSVTAADNPAAGTLRRLEGRPQGEPGMIQSTYAISSHAQRQNSTSSAQDVLAPIPNAGPHPAPSVGGSDESRVWTAPPVEIGTERGGPTRPAVEQNLAGGNPPTPPVQGKVAQPTRTSAVNRATVEPAFIEGTAVTARSDAGHSGEIEQAHRGTHTNTPILGQHVAQPAAQPLDPFMALPDDEDLEIAELSALHRPVTGEVSGPVPAPHMSTSPNTVATPTRQLSEAIIRSGPDAGETELVLSPDELGQVRFSIRNVDGQLSIVISAERPETMALLRRNADQLGAELAQSGMGGAALDFGGGGQTGERGTPSLRADASGRGQTPVIQPEPEQDAGTIRSASVGGRINLRL